MILSAPLPTTCGSVWQADAVRIVAIREDTADTRTYDLQTVDPQRAAAYVCRPGQFNMLYLPAAGEAAISISGRSPSDGRIVHTVRAVGTVTSALAKLKIGDTLGIRGPFGTAWPMQLLSGRDVIVVAGGIGLAPLRPVIYEIFDRRGDFQSAALLYGARTPSDLLYTDEFATWEAAGINVSTTVDRAGQDWPGRVGVVTLLLDSHSIPDPPRTHVVICGPEVMMHYVAMSAIRKGIPAQNIWVTLERNMNCAVGLCGHCQLGPEFICKDGPVFPYPRVADLLKVKEL